MNERFLELAKQAGKYADETQPRSSYTRDGMWLYAYNEKFSELIIQQCFSICEDLGDQGLDGHYCADEIKRTFGVKA